MGGLGKPVASDLVAPSTMVEAVSRALSAAPSLQPLGRVVRAAWSGVRGRAVGRGWSSRVSAAEPATTEGIEAEAGDLPSSSKRRVRRVSAAVPAQAGHDNDPRSDDLGDDYAPPTPAVKRVRIVDRPRTMDEQVQDAPVPCVRKAAGLPSFSAMGSGSARVTATIVADPVGPSRAILLRCGHRRNESAILWVSSRGGLLCSCLSGTQNASFPSVSGRSAECQDTKMMDSCLPVAGLSAGMVRSCLGLRDSARDFGSPRWHVNSLVVYVLYRQVFSIVNFVRNLPTCIAPGCRVFSRRCGHVRIARRVRDGMPKDVAERCGHADVLMIKPKVAGTSGSRPLYLSHEEEDDGVEKQPPDTLRTDGDVPEARVCDRRVRKMLPCTGEISMGEVWVRTADWRRIIVDMSTAVDPKKADDLKVLLTCYQSMLRRGLARDTRNVLVESHCGSCGLARGPRYAVSADHALLSTQHATAPPMKVRAPNVLAPGVLLASFLSSQCLLPAMHHLTRHTLFVACWLSIVTCLSHPVCCLCS